MATAGRVLVVEDHETERRAISQILKAEGFTVFGSENADKAMGYIDENIDIVISDLNMGDVSGMDLLQLWKKKQPETQFMLVSGQASVSSAVEAMKNGAFDYLTKPINPDELILQIKRAVESVAKDKEIDSLRRRLDHLIGVQQGFLSILRGEPPGGPKGGPPRSFDELKARAQTVHAGLDEFAANLDSEGLSRMVRIHWFPDPPCIITVSEATN